MGLSDRGWQKKKSLVFLRQLKLEINKGAIVFRGQDASDSMHFDCNKPYQKFALRSRPRVDRTRPKRSRGSQIDAVGRDERNETLLTALRLLNR